MAGADGAICQVARHGRTVAGWTRSIEFSPTERMSAEDLFGSLLSANLALLEHDDFNQMKSALCRLRVDAILALHWGVTSKDECLRVLDRRLGCLGVPSPAEIAAYTAWRYGWPIDSEDCRALFETGKLLANEARIIKMEDIRDAHLNPMAWDIQVAYLVRLGLAAGHLSREHADGVFTRLRQLARVHYQCWRDFSLSALIGMGMRTPIDPFDLRGWHR
ncbi:MAG: DUF1266 domain-containing protein, partial [Variovorax sp.]